MNPCITEPNCSLDETDLSSTTVEFYCLLWLRNASDLKVASDFESVRIKA